MILIDDMAKEFAKEIAKKSAGYIEKSLKEKKEDIEHFFNNKFSKYFELRTSYLNTSTSQLFRNKDYKISDLYEPLTIKNKSTNKSFTIDSFPERLTEKTNKILLVDSAGMGKSTLLKMLFMYSINQKRSIPFYIDLKSMLKDGKVLKVEELMINEFPSFKDIPTLEFIEKQLDENKFTFLLDGADEVPDSMKQKVFDNVHSFQKKCINGEFIIASRNEDIILSSFNDYQIHDINELRRSQAYNIIRNYKFKDVDAEQLIEEIEKKENQPVLEFLKNPLLTTLLYTAYSFKRTIPLKKSHFFKQIYQSLYENHDATKIGYLTREKMSGLDIDAFEKIISHIAFISRIQEKLNYKENELIETINKIKLQHPTIRFDTRLFIKDIISRVPIIKKDGLDYVWQHKSIQEYFFATFITKTIPSKDRESFIRKLTSAENPKSFKLTFDILFDEDEDLFHKSITNEICEYCNAEAANHTPQLEEVDDFRMCAVFDNINVNAAFGKERFSQIRAEIIEKSKAHIDHKRFRLANWTHTPGLTIASFDSKKITLIEVLFEKKSKFISSEQLTLNEMGESKLLIDLRETRTKDLDTISKISIMRRQEIIKYKVNLKKINSFTEKSNNARNKIIESLQLFDIDV